MERERQRILQKIYFQKYDIGMYPTHNEGKSVVAEKFIGT